VREGQDAREAAVGVEDGLEAKNAAKKILKTCVRMQSVNNSSLLDALSE